MNYQTWISIKRTRTHTKKYVATEVCVAGLSTNLSDMEYYALDAGWLRSPGKGKCKIRTCLHRSGSWNSFNHCWVCWIVQIVARLTSDQWQKYMLLLYALICVAQRPRSKLWSRRGARSRQRGFHWHVLRSARTCFKINEITIGKSSKGSD